MNYQAKIPGQRPLESFCESGAVYPLNVLHFGIGLSRYFLASLAKNASGCIGAWPPWLTRFSGIPPKLSVAFWLYSIAAVLTRVRSVILERERNTDWVRQLGENA